MSYALRDQQHLEDFCASAEGLALLAVAGDPPVYDDNTGILTNTSTNYLNEASFWYEHHLRGSDYDQWNGSYQSVGNYSYMGPCQPQLLKKAINNIYFYNIGPTPTETCCLLRDPYTRGIMLTWLIRNQTMTGASGHIALTDEGDRDSTYHFVNVQNGTVVVVGRFVDTLNVTSFNATASG
jgi:hypothetical protein